MKRNLSLYFILLLVTAAEVFGAVEVRRLPDGAMQPFAVTDDSGTVHLVWLQGEPKSCDVFYQRLSGGRTNGTAPMRVNRHPGSAIAIGTIRGAQVAVGRNGRVHVVWNGSSKAEPKPAEGTPLLYSRLEESATAFEPDRNLLGKTAMLDGGASVAADRAGNVYVVWHAAPDPDHAGEPERRVFLARSADDGVNFQHERSISVVNGVCGCCALRAFADRAGNVQVLYRAATARTERDMMLLSSTNHGDTFTQVFSDPWATGSCPMSSASLVDSPQAVFAAWETKGKVQVTAIRHERHQALPAASVSDGNRAKHPAIAVNLHGEALCAWAEGTGWQKGGSVVWRLLDAMGKPIGEPTTQPGLPVWSFPAAFARDDGQFVVVF
jgi:hypothetical protein